MSDRQPSNMEKEDNAALVLFSGGQDSTICLHYALERHTTVHALTFAYSQKHWFEVNAAQTIASMVGLASHEVLELPPNILKSSSPLVNSDAELGQYDSVTDLPCGVEPTFIPGRNILFLTLAANRAVAVGASVLYVGVCEADSLGYPDCRGLFISGFSNSLGDGFYGDNRSFDVRTPLMQLDKRQSTLLSVTLPGCSESLRYSHTCYNGSVPPCGRCHACLLRARGFYEAGIPDPLIERCISKRVLPADYPKHGLLEAKA